MSSIYVSRGTRTHDTTLLPAYYIGSLICTQQCLLTFIIALSLVEAERVSETATYTHKSATCIKCPLGTRVLQHCTRNFTKSDCMSCESGTYQALSHTHLTRCGVCDHGCQDINAIVVRNCSPEHNLLCQCGDGYFNKHHGDGVMACVPFTQCEEGQIVQEGGPVKDVECAWCPEHHFYNTTDGQCSGCTPCVHPNITLTQCSRLADAECGLSSTGASPVAAAAGLDTKTIVGIAIPSTCVVIMVVLGCYDTFKRRSPHIPRSPDEAEEPFLEASDINVWTRQVYQKIASKVHNWQGFLRHLPSPDNEFEADLEIERSMEPNATEKIYQLLNTWTQACYNSVTIEAIIRALRESGNAGIIPDVRRTYNEAVKSSQNCELETDRPGATDGADNDTREDCV